MRLLVTADLHYNHPRCRQMAEDIIEEMNRAGGDVLLVVGDTATADGDDLEQCLSRFEFAGPKLLVAGNHELWTRGPDSYQLHAQELPRRAAEIGWHWLENSPWVSGDLAIVGSVGWYDYSFAQRELNIPRRFYERKISPGVAARSTEHRNLLAEDVTSQAMKIFARWNDGVHVKLGRSDEVFLSELLERLEQQLMGLKNVKTVVAAVHCLPFTALLPPSHSAQWDFAKAFLGSERIGDLLLSFENMTRVYCGHSHFPAEAHVGQISAINIGSGYRMKYFRCEEVG